MESMKKVQSLLPKSGTLVHFKNDDSNQFSIPKLEKLEKMTFLPVKTSFCK